jgi:hypothetical protein
MSMDNMFSIEITHGTATNLIIDILRDDIKCLRQDIKNYENRANLESWEQEDLSSWREYEAAMVKVLHYYLPPSEWASAEST